MGSNLMQSMKMALHMTFSYDMTSFQGVIIVACVPFVSGFLS